MMPPDSMYGWLVERGNVNRLGGEDIHVLACLLSIAWREAVESNLPWRHGLGLSQAELTSLLAVCFPAAPPVLAEQPGERPPPLSGDGGDDGCLAEDEIAVRDLLWMHVTGGTVLQRALAVMIARRCSRPRHLWQDLGLRDRGELSALIQRHFSRLFERNRQNMKWKKFFFRMICRTEGFSLCVAPVCGDCDDFDACFGPEDGEAMLAHVRAGGMPA